MFIYSIADSSVLISPCLHAFSTWVMVNLQKRKVAKIPDEMRRKLARFAPDPVRCVFSLHSTEMSAFVDTVFAPLVKFCLSATCHVTASVNISSSIDRLSSTGIVLSTSLHAAHLRCVKVD